MQVDVVILISIIGTICGIVFGYIGYRRGLGKEVATVQDAITVLVSKGVINTPGFWENATNYVKNLDQLLIKFANYVNKG